MSFPSGATVEVRNYGGRSLTVSVKAPEDDWAATEGLCGTFDGQTSNDLKYSDGHFGPAPSGGFKDNNFVDSWR